MKALLDTDSVNLPPHGRPKKLSTGQRDPLQPCMRCQQPTHRATLSLFGSRCVTCYEAFCRGESA